MTLEDGAYFAKGEMPSSSNTHAIPWGNILLWTTPPLLAYTALKLSTWIYCVCYCCLLLSKHNNQTTNNNNNSDNQYRIGHPTTTTQFLDVIVTDLSGVFEILACHSSFWKGEDGTISSLYFIVKYVWKKVDSCYHHAVDSLNRLSDSGIQTRNFVYLVRWCGQLMCALAGQCLPY